MHFTVLTLFPNLFQSYLSDSIIERAIKNKIIKVDFENIRDYSKDKHKKVDDKPYGGGPGMVMTAQPLYDCIKATKKKNKGKVIYLSPQGKKLTQSRVEKLAHEKAIILLCGRYEGIDQRIRDLLVDEEISVGDYVLTGGELPAMTIIDSVTRLLPGALGDKNSAHEDSFSASIGRKREYPHYTKPAIFKGEKVPDVLTSGNHAKIAKWRKEHLK